MFKRLLTLTSLAAAVVVLFATPRYSSAELEPQKLGYINDVVELLCADGGLWLECYRHDPLKCRDTLKPLVHTCVERHLADAKLPIRLQTALERNVLILECFNTEFPKTIGANPKDEPRCKEQPKHLR
jgi:hypothetical protein